MEIEYLNEANAAQWDDFAEKSSSAWFRHTIAWQKYSSCCRFDSDTRNFSFMVKQGGKIQAIVPLLMEYSYPERDIDAFSMYGDYTPMPAYADKGEVSRTSVFEVIQEEIARISAENPKLSYGKFMVDPLIRYPYFSDFAPFDLLGAGTGISVTTTNVIDLTNDLDEILRRMRKGHKAAIKQVMKEPGFRVDVFDKNNADKDVLLRFKYIHRMDAGRQTRTDASWDCMYEWIESGNASLVMLWMDEVGDYAAGALIMHYKTGAYYASYATLDSMYLNGHCGYIIQWEAVRHLKSIGIETYETGENHISLSDSAEERKLAEISKYKKGFRTYEIPKITFRKDYSSR